MGLNGSPPADGRSDGRNEQFNHPSANPLKLSNGLSELVADLQAGARHAVVRPVAEIGMRGMGDLGHDIPVDVETIAGAQIFVEEDATAEFRAVIIALEIAGMDDAAEAGFGKDLLVEIDRPGETGEELSGFARRADRGAEMDAECNNCCCQPTAVS